jgi:hypothetical protein
MSNKSQAVNLTPSEATMLTAFRGMSEADRRFMIRYAQLRAAKNNPKRPAFRLISGGKATS